MRIAIISEGVPDGLVHDMICSMQEKCGPLGMGSRGVDEPQTPHKDRGGAHAMHMGLLKLAHKVSPMRIAGRGGGGPDLAALTRGFPGF